MQIADGRHSNDGRGARLIADSHETHHLRAGRCNSRPTHNGRVAFSRGRGSGTQDAIAEWSQSSDSLPASDRMQSTVRSFVPSHRSAAIASRSNSKSPVRSGKNTGASSTICSQSAPVPNSRTRSAQVRMMGCAPPRSGIPLPCQPAAVNTCGCHVLVCYGEPVDFVNARTSLHEHLAVLVNKEARRANDGPHGEPSCASITLGRGLPLPPRPGSRCRTRTRGRLGFSVARYFPSTEKASRTFPGVPPAVG